MYKNHRYTILRIIYIYIYIYEFMNMYFSHYEGCNLFALFQH